jgi:hypothetical protein
MTREEILQTFSDINNAYNNSTKYDTLKRMLDELTEPCEDCISRQQAIDKMQELEDEDDEMYGCSIPEGFDGKRAIEALKTLPSIQPKPKTESGIHCNCTDAEIAKSFIEDVEAVKELLPQIESEDKE